MAQFKLIPYSIRLKRLEDNDYVNNLSNIDGNNSNFLDMLESYLRDTNGARVLRDKMKTIFISRIERDNRDLYGLAEGGEYGISASFTNIETLEITPQARMPTHSEGYPFLFYIRIPENTNKGFIILQQYRTHGIKTNLQSIINENIRPLGFELTLGNLISRDLMDQIESSSIMSLRLIRYDIPQDRAERVHEGEPQEIIEEHVFRAKRNKKIDIAQSIKDILVSERETRYYEVLDERYNEIKILINRGRDTKTLTFGDSQKCLESMPLNTPPGGGFPEYQQLLREARSYLMHLDMSFRGVEHVRPD